MKKTLIALTFGLASLSASHAITLLTSGSTTQNFDTLVSSGSTTWVDNSTLTGWYAQRTGNGTQIVATNGSLNGGSLYSAGTTGSSDRAIGSLGSSNAAAGSFAWGVQFQNNSGGNLTFNTLSYVGEEWRSGATAAQTVTFWYQISSSAITSLTPNVDTGWTAVTALDFTSPNITGTGQIDGTLSANQVALSSNLNLTLTQGQYIMFRWSDIDHPSSDDLLAVDDFKVSYTAVPEPTTTAMLLGGVGAMFWIIRRKRSIKA
ncbi:hypothetical protein BH09VER1_BH09VER1_41290 [soil metagenome]